MASIGSSRFADDDDDSSSSVGSLTADTENLKIASYVDERFNRHMHFLRQGNGPELTGDSAERQREEIRTSPVISGKVLDAHNALLPQCGLLAQRISTHRPSAVSATVTDEENSGHVNGALKIGREDPRIYINTNTPWSAFICGSQGSGKSHTLSCMLENCVLGSSICDLPKPLAAIVFHYDRYTSYASGQVCEAAYLCSKNIPVTVIVSPTNLHHMQNVYSNLEGLEGVLHKPTVKPLLFTERNLNVARMKKLMAISDTDGPVPLYVEAIMRILRQMAIDNKGVVGFNYQVFKTKLAMESFSGTQNGPLKLRMDLLESFMADQGRPAARVSASKATDWSFKPGTITIVDLSCPFVDESVACTLFAICLEIFEEHRGNLGLVVALDEAHKFMTATDAATAFTESLLAIIRQQRHLATRVIIATQEPTISPKLLDLSTMTIVHRFTSPDWFRELQSHLAAITVADGESKKDVKEIMSTIVNLDAGQALLFSPTAMLGLSKMVDGSTRAEKLGMGYIKMRVRQRLTVDGGRSITAL